MLKTRIIFLLLAVVLLSGSSAAEDSADDWALRQQPNARAEDTVERWCEIEGSRVRYANFPIPGYRPCGAVNVSRSCDPVGKRFFGPGAPYQYLECGKGPRIQVFSSMKGEDYRGSSDAESDIGSDLAALEAQRKEYDSLLDNRSNRAPSRKDVTSSDLSKKLSDALNALPIDSREIAQALETLSGRNEELRKLLDE